MSPSFFKKWKDVLWRVGISLSLILSPLEGRASFIREYHPEDKLSLGCGIGTGLVTAYCLKEAFLSLSEEERKSGFPGKVFSSLYIKFNSFVSKKKERVQSFWAHLQKEREKKGRWGIFKGLFSFQAPKKKEDALGIKPSRRNLSKSEKVFITVLSVGLGLGVAQGVRSLIYAWGRRGAREGGIQRAIQVNNPQKLGLYQRSQANFKEKLPNRRPLLWEVVLQYPERLHLLPILVAGGADIQEKFEGKTLLYQAVCRKDTRMVQVLLEQGANPHEIWSSEKETALYYLVSRGYPWEMVWAFLKAGANPNLKSGRDKKTPLYKALKRKDLKVADCLLKKGADLALLYESEWKDFLHEIVKEGEESFLQLLLSYPVKVNDYSQRGLTPLHEAANSSKDRGKIIALLIQAGANVHKTSSSNKTPLYYAIKRKNLTNATALLKEGADPNERGIGKRIGKKKTALYKVGCFYPFEKDFFEVFLNAGGDINEKSGHPPKTLLYKATQDKNLERIQYLLEKGADPCILCQKRSPLQQALIFYKNSKSNYHKTSFLEMIKVLLKGGADPNELWEDGEKTVLFYAFSFVPFEKKVFELLLEVKGDINRKHNSSSRTLLYEAVKTNQLHQVKYLVEKGADPNVLCEERGRTSLHLALKRKNDSIASYLLDKGANPFIQNLRGQKSCFYLAFSKSQANLFSKTESLEELDINENHKGVSLFDLVCQSDQDCLIIKFLGHSDLNLNLCKDGLETLVKNQKEEMVIPYLTPWRLDGGEGLMNVLLQAGAYKAARHYEGPYNLGKGIEPFPLETKEQRHILFWLLKNGAHLPIESFISELKKQDGSLLEIPVSSLLGEEEKEEYPFIFEFLRQHPLKDQGVSFKKFLESYGFQNQSLKKRAAAAITPAQLSQLYILPREVLETILRETSHLSVYKATYKLLLENGSF